MRLAALYDIHGNLPALEAVLQEIYQLGVDHIVVGGDIVPGPMCRDVLSCLLSLPIPVQFIQGNCEREMFEATSGTSNLPAQYQDRLRWVAQALGEENTAFLASWPKTLRIESPDAGEILFCHATPRDDNEIFTRLTAEEKLIPIFEGLNIVACGHTHMQFDRMIGKTRVINAGSVGMPFQDPGAYWLLIGPGVELRRTDYDLNKAAERVRATSYPQAEAFADESILHPPSETEMLEQFGRAELKA